MSRYSHTEHLIDLLELFPAEECFQGAEEANALVNQLEEFIGDMTMTLVIPDRNKEQREDFVWCLPVIRKSWQKWYDLAVKFKSITPQGVRYMNRMEGKKVMTVMILPNSDQSDDDAMVACAWLRMVKQMDCRMYVIRCTDDLPSPSKTIMDCAGADPQLVQEVDDGNPSNAQDTEGA